MIAIVGGTGAGKGWMAGRLCKLLGEHACRLSLDDFYRDRSHLAPARRARVNFDIPRAIDWSCAKQVLNDCRLGQATRVPRYDFSTHSQLPVRDELQPRPLVLVEGLWLLWPRSTRGLFALKIYLDCPASLRLSRRRVRDVAERGRTADAVERQFQMLAPLHERYVEPQKRWADLILTQPFKEEDIAQLASRLWQLLEAGSLSPCWVQETFLANLFLLMKSDEYSN
jgi:uridine kinase